MISIKNGNDLISGNWMKILKMIRKNTPNIDFIVGMAQSFVNVGKSTKVGKNLLCVYRKSCYKIIMQHKFMVLFIV